MPRPIALSFSGGGMLLTYHLGVASYLLRPDGRLSSRITRFAGASSGALAAAAVALLGRPGLARFVDSHACRGEAWAGLLDVLRVASPGLGVGKRAGTGAGSAGPLAGSSLESGAGDDAARLRDVLFIGATECRTGRAALFSRFGSNEQLARCLLASCAFPPSAHPFDLLRAANTYLEASGVAVPPSCEWVGTGGGVTTSAGGRLPWSPHGEAYVDGGLSAAAPLLPRQLQCHTITVSPISGPQGVRTPASDGPCAHLHLCPLDSSLRVPLIAPALAGMRCYLSVNNLRAAGESVGASGEALSVWYGRGVADAERFEAGLREGDLP